MKMIISRLKKISLLLILLPIAIAISIISILQLCFSYIFSDGDRGWKIIVGYDRIGDIVLGGRGVETFSARCYRTKTEKYNKLEKIVDKIFLVIADQQNHCKEAFTDEMISSKLHYEKHKYLL